MADLAPKPRALDDSGVRSAEAELAAARFVCHVRADEAVSTASAFQKQVGQSGKFKGCLCNGVKNAECVLHGANAVASRAKRPTPIPPA